MCACCRGNQLFLRLAEQAGWRTVFLGPAVSIDEFIEATQHENADMVGDSYRLTAGADPDSTPETGTIIGYPCYTNPQNQWARIEWSNTITCGEG